MLRGTRYPSNYISFIGYLKGNADDLHLVHLGLQAWFYIEKRKAKYHKAPSLTDVGFEPSLMSNF